MFSFAESFNQPLDSWNVSKGKEFSRMFEGAYCFNQPLVSWQIDDSANIDEMFAFKCPISDEKKPKKAYNV